MPRVSIPSQLRSYTRGAREVEMPGATLADVLAALDAAFPGIRFRVIDEQDRIRQHIRIYVDEDAADSIRAAVPAGKMVHIIGALSGG